VRLKFKSERKWNKIKLLKVEHQMQIDYSEQEQR